MCRVVPNPHDRAMTPTRTTSLRLAAAVAVVFALFVTLLPTAGAATTAPTRPPRPEREVPDADEPSLPYEQRLARYGELRFVVDPAVVPGKPVAEPLPGTRAQRPVGAVALPEGGSSEMILDEVVL